VVKRCIVCARVVSDEDISAGRAYYGGDICCCADCLKKISESRAKRRAEPRSPVSRVVVHYCLRCGVKVPPEDVAAGKAISVGENCVCSRCSEPILRMLEEADKGKKTAAASKHTTPTSSYTKTAMMPHPAQSYPAPPPLPATEPEPPTQKPRKFKPVIIVAAVLVGVFIALLTTSYLSKRSALKQLFSKVNQLIAERRFSEALQKITSFIDENPSLATSATVIGLKRRLKERASGYLDGVVDVLAGLLLEIEKGRVEASDKALRLLAEVKNLAADFAEFGMALKDVDERLRKILVSFLRRSWQAVGAPVVEARRKLRMGISDDLQWLSLSDIDGCESLIRRIRRTSVVDFLKEAEWISGFRPSNGAIQVEQALQDTEVSLKGAEERAARFLDRLAAKILADPEGTTTRPVDKIDNLPELRRSLSVLEQVRHKRTRERAARLLRYLEAAIKKVERRFAVDMKEACAIVQEAREAVVREQLSRAISNVEKAIGKIQPYRRYSFLGERPQGYVERWSELLLEWRRRQKEEVARQKREREMGVLRQALEQKLSTALKEAAKLQVAIRHILAAKTILKSGKGVFPDNEKDLWQKRIEDTTKKVVWRWVVSAGTARLSARKAAVGSNDPFDEAPPPHPYQMGEMGFGITEVSNKRFYEFAKAGGYASRRYWDKEGWRLLKSGAFCDRTGKVGPAFWRDGRPPPGEENKPVVGVSWYEAVAYCRWQTERMSREVSDVGYKVVVCLPTAEEWEAAAGAGNRIFPWGNKRGNAALALTSPVDVTAKTEDRTPEGLLYMGGNVSEWTSTTDDATAVIKGGNWSDESPEAARVTFRQSLPKKSRLPYVGFRVVIKLEKR